jgi:hypothetical protein
MTKNDDPYPGCQRHSAILRFTRKSDFERVRRVRDLLYTAKETSSSCSVAVSWGEIVTVVCQRHDLLGAREILGNLSALPITIMPVDAKAIKSAEVFKYRFKSPLAEAFAGTLTLGLSVKPPRDQATLFTADFDFNNVPEGTIRVELLPTK